jgi:hypothetical protein
MAALGGWSPAASLPWLSLWQKVRISQSQAGTAVTVPLDSVWGPKTDLIEGFEYEWGFP